MMALIQSSAALAATCSTFGQYAKRLYQVILAKAGLVQRIDVVCDRYDKEDSIKHGERLRRTDRIQPLVVHINASTTRLPKQFSRFLASSENKSSLADFLLREWLTLGKEMQPGQCMHIAGCSKLGGHLCEAVYSTGAHETIDELACWHEEADTRMIFHASHAFDKGLKHVIIHSPDTDVMVIAIAMADKLPGALTFCTGMGEKRRYIDIKDIASTLGFIPSQNLVAMHALTGCDTTSAFYGVGKQAAFTILLTHPSLLNDLGTSFDPSPEVYSHAEKFIILCYSKGKSSADSINSYRYQQFLKNQRPNQNACWHSGTTSRANYQVAIWRRSTDGKHIVPSPVGRGWNAEMQPVLIDELPAPKTLLVLHTCRCTKGCSARCSCKKNNLNCTPGCGCGPETCFAVDDCDSDTDT